MCIDLNKVHENSFWPAYLCVRVSVSIGYASKCCSCICLPSAISADLFCLWYSIPQGLRRGERGHKTNESENI